MALNKVTKQCVAGASSIHNDITGTDDSGSVKSILIATDGANDPTITVFDAATAAGANYILPPCPFDGSALGLNGVSNANIPFSTGISILCTGAGTHYVTITW